MQLKVRDVLKLITEGGWYLIATRGSHRQFKHPKKRGRVTVAGGLSKEVPPGTLKSILRQADLKPTHEP